MNSSLDCVPPLLSCSGPLCCNSHNLLCQSLRPLLPRSGLWSPTALPQATVESVHCYPPESHETNEEFDAPWVTYFNKPDTDAYELSKGMNMLVGYDLVPEPKIIDAALQAQTTKIFH